jgi:hypothetical protein
MGNCMAHLVSIPVHSAEPVELVHPPRTSYKLISN